MKITTDLHRHPVNIRVALKDYAGQEGCDGGEYDVMMHAADYIKRLEDAAVAVEGIISEDKAIIKELRAHIKRLNNTVDRLHRERLNMMTIPKLLRKNMQSHKVRAPKQKRRGMRRVS